MKSRRAAFFITSLATIFAITNLALIGASAYSYNYNISPPYSVGGGGYSGVSGSCPQTQSEVYSTGYIDIGLDNLGWPCSTSTWQSWFDQFSIPPFPLFGNNQISVSFAHLDYCASGPSATIQIIAILSSGSKNLAQTTLATYNSGTHGTITSGTWTGSFSTTVMLSLIAGSYAVQIQVLGHVAPSFGHSATVGASSCSGVLSVDITAIDFDFS